VIKGLNKINKKDADRIFRKLQSDLAENPEDFPEIQGQFAGLQKFRVGRYRIICSIIANTVLVVRIQHRKDVYRN
jgi:mRNA interferase RelE/StbE